MVWRSRPGGAVGYTIPAIVLDHAEEFTVLFQPKNTICKRRSGRRGGPRGRNMVAWDGAHEDRRYTGPSTARLHVFETGFEVVRAWGEDGYRGWYINLVEPWERTRLGFDTRDLSLDILVEPDLSAWRWKDEDELAWAVGAGKIDKSESDRIYSLGHTAIERLQDRAFPFTETHWRHLRPDPAWPVPRLPSNWKDTSP